MKFHQQLMSDAKVQEEKLGKFAKRSPRSQWATGLEAKVRDSAPFPASYDISPTQPTEFSEFAYTEIAGGMWVYAQSVEINCRIIDAAAKKGDRSLSTIDSFLECAGDKYLMDEAPDRWKGKKKVCFLPGHNMLDVASREIVARLAFEDQDVAFKPHPVTEEKALGVVVNNVGGWNRVVPKDVSGFSLIKEADVVYVCSASEISIIATALGKKVVNISNFFNEHTGIYHPISRLLYTAHRDGSVQEAQQILAAILNCDDTGLLFPWMQDIDKRLENYYRHALSLRETYRSMSAPRAGFGRVAAQQ